MAGADGLAGSDTGNTLTVGDDWEELHGAMKHGRDAQKNRAFNGPWAAARNGWFAAGYGAQRRISGGLAEANEWMQVTDRHAAFGTLFREDASLLHPIQWLMDLQYRSIDDAQTSAAKREAKRLVDTVLAFIRDDLLPEGFSVAGVNSNGLRVHARGTELSLRGWPTS